ncbi:MAG: hypothetical protein HC828_09125 [Blastochloris sp.]|nr:hypothetical protein [Blastochloris sp.]
MGEPLDNQNPFDHKRNADREPGETKPLKSPIRPTRASVQPPSSPPAPRPAEKSDGASKGELPTNPESALRTLRRKMEQISDEFANGRLNRAQFHAVYQRYNEQRTIIERMLERNPETDAWRSVMGTQGQTGFLRTYYQAQMLYFLIYRHNNFTPILTGGRQKPDETLIAPLMQQVWRLENRPRSALGQKKLTDTKHFVLALGEHAATAVVFNLEPSSGQARLVRDLHADFERANQAALARGWIIPERMVFPQRALAEGAQ